MPPEDLTSAPSKPSPAARECHSVLREVVAVYTAVTIAVGALAQVRAPGWLEDLALLTISAIFLGIPLQLGNREERGAQRFGIDLSGLLEPDDRSPEGDGTSRGISRMLSDAWRELGFAALVALVLFPPFVLGFAWWNGAPPGGFRFEPDSELLSYSIGQFVLIALPEEAFFRGYIQTRLHDCFAPRHRVLGARLHLGVLVAQAGLFALIHLVGELALPRLAVFFPGLVFGWMRARRGGIAAALVFHASCNILATVLARGWW